MASKQGCVIAMTALHIALTKGWWNGWVNSFHRPMISLHQPVANNRFRTSGCRSVDCVWDLGNLKVISFDLEGNCNSMHIILKKIIMVLFCQVAACCNPALPRAVNESQMKHFIQHCFTRPQGMHMVVHMRCGPLSIKAQAAS